MSDRSIRVLFTARDAGAAQAVEALFHEANQRERVSVHVIAEGVAARYLRARSVPHEEVAWGSTPLAPAQSAPGEAHSIVAAARQRLESLEVDAIVTGLSGPTAGLDEAIAAVASQPTFAIQDYWGDVNPGFGRIADYFLVQDEYARDLSDRRGAKRSGCFVVGSIKHAHLHDHAVEAQQGADAWRRRLGVSPEDAIVLFCGQPLWDNEGYGHTVDVLARTVARRANTLFVYRPHPAEPKPSPAQNRIALGARQCIDASCDLYAALAASNATLSVFSSCGWDQIMLARVLGRAIGAVGYVLYDDRMQNLVHRYTGVPTPPPFELGVAGCFSFVDELPDEIERMLDPRFVEGRARRIADVVPDPRHSASRALDAVLQTVTDQVGVGRRTGGKNER